MKNAVSVLTVVVLFSVSTSTAIANPGVPDQADHVNTWHNTGSDHQNNNNPGDTAADRHNFDGATAGKSDTNPGAGVQD